MYSALVRSRVCTSAAATHGKVWNSVLELWEKGEEEVVAVGGRKGFSLLLLPHTGLLKLSRIGLNTLEEGEGKEGRGDQYSQRGLCSQSTAIVATKYSHHTHTGCHWLL